LWFGLRTSFLICAYNEENTIEKTLQSVLNQSLKPDEIVVVDDGSTDATPAILKRYENTVKIVSLKANTGNKARAQMVGLKHLSGDIVAYTDADTMLHPSCLEKVIPHFMNREVGGVAGQVVSNKHNWLTAVRQIQYVLGQAVYKNGMNMLNTITVVPGCVGAVRRNLFQVSTDTITEDTDLTLSILSLGQRIVYESKAVAYTDDPPNLGSYVRQLTRWNSGFVQNVKKHFNRLPLRLKLTLLLLTLENSLFSIITLATIPLFSSGKLWPLYFLLFDLAIMAAVALYGVLKLSRYDLLFAIPLLMFVRIIDGMVWLKCLFKEALLKRPDLKWHRADRLPLNNSKVCE